MSERPLVTHEGQGGNKSGWDDLAKMSPDDSASGGGGITRLRRKRLLA